VAYGSDSPAIRGGVARDTAAVTRKIQQAIDQGDGAVLSMSPDELEAGAHPVLVKLFDQDDRPVVVPDPVGGSQEIEFAGEFTAAKDADAAEGSTGRVVIALNLSPGLPLLPGQRYEWRVTIDWQHHPSWDVGFLTRKVSQRRTSRIDPETKRSAHQSQVRPLCCGEASTPRHVRPAPTSTAGRRTPRTRATWSTAASSRCARSHCRRTTGRAP
jgi:hypothetical protein